jgi:imidazolonepropionase-like amidohydrolase
MAWLGPGHVVHDALVAWEADIVAYAGPAQGTPYLLGDGPIHQIDGFLMPAPADRHVHIGMSNAAAVLQGGVTAVRDLAWPPDQIFPLADASEGPSFNGPLIRAAGPMLTARGGYPTRATWAPPGTGKEVVGSDQAAAAVAELARRGAAHIKVSLNAEAGPTPSDAELAAICSAAAEHRLPVTAHAQGAGQAERALGAGIGELAHCPWTERLSDPVVETMARAGMRVVSTLDIHSYGQVTPELRTALDNLRRFYSAGGAVLYGTDLGNGAIPPGIDLREVLLLAEAGLSNEAVLRAITRAPLERGGPADVIALTGSPFEDLEVFEDVLFVMRGGRVVSL